MCSKTQSWIRNFPVQTSNNPRRVQCHGGGRIESRRRFQPSYQDLGGGTRSRLHPVCCSHFAGMYHPCTTTPGEHTRNSKNVCVQDHDNIVKELVHIACHWATVVSFCAKRGANHSHQARLHCVKLLGLYAHRHTYITKGKLLLLYRKKMKRDSVLLQLVWQPPFGRWANLAFKAATSAGPCALTR